MSTDHESPTENIYERTLNRVSDAIVSVDDDFRYTYLNQRAEELLAKSQSELLGEVIWDAFPETQNTIAQDRIEEALHTNQETKYDRYNGTLERWFEVRVFPDSDGLSIFFSDITEGKEREIELERYEHIIETLPVAVGQNEPGRDGGFAYVNQGMVEMFDLESKAEAKQYSPAELYADPQEREIFGKKLQSNGEVNDYELKLEKPDGEQFWGSATASIETIDGEEYFVGIIQNIDERKEFKEKLQDLHDATREMVSVSDPDYIADIVTRTADRSIGYEMNGVHLYDDSIEGLAPTSISETSQELIGDVPVLDEGIAWKAFQTDETRVCNNLEEADNVFNEETALGSELAIPIGNHGVLLASDTEVGAFRDDDLTLIKILAKNAETVLDQLQTEQQLRKRERELRRNKEFLEQTQEVADVGGWEANHQTGVQRWTDEVYRIHGLPADENVTIEGGIQFYHPEDRDRIRDAVERTMTDGEPYDLELRLVGADDEVRWVRTRGRPQYNQDDEITGAIGTLQDITKRKEREEELRKQNERLDEFASLISHDLRNPLTVAIGRTTILQQMCEGEQAEQLDVVASSLDRMESIIEDTLTLARKGETVEDVEPVSLLELCGKCWQGVDTLEATLNIKDDIKIKGDANRFKHVLENLFRNAVEHGNDSVTITIGRIDKTGFYVEDDGPGISEDARDAVFEAGYSSEKDGTGLGLSIVKRIAQAHGWEVTVTEGSDGGARFEFENVEFDDT